LVILFLNIHELNQRRKRKIGTNYYARTDSCKTCNRQKEEIHIGKSSYGWTFSFHATDEIRSYQEWLKFLERYDVKIYDEYDEEISLKRFKEIIESKKDEKHNHAREYPEGNYLDEEGHSMNTGDFR